jgi:phage tail sheath gpL-like
MATTTHVVTITTTEDIGTPKLGSGKEPIEGLRTLGNFFDGMACGTKFGTVDVQTNGGTAVAASGTVTISSGSGAIAAVINGVSISVTWATSDNNTASLLKTAINASANALVAGIVAATSATNVVTITAATKGTTGNCITLSATGTGATASGARLTGGANASANSVAF